MPKLGTQKPIDGYYTVHVTEADYERILTIVKALGCTVPEAIQYALDRVDPDQLGEPK